MTTHTPGPWTADRRFILATVDGKLTCIAQTYSGASASLDEADANDALIAAAPDMLAALRLVFAEVLGPAPHSEFSFLPPVVVDQLRAVINKATGGKA